MGTSWLGRCPASSGSQGPVPATLDPASPCRQQPDSGTLPRGTGPLGTENAARIRRWRPRRRGLRRDLQYLKGGPQYTVFAKETETARSRTTEYGANYPTVSQAMWTAIQSAITGTSSVNSALSQARSTISGISKVSG